MRELKPQRSPVGQLRTRQAGKMLVPLLGILAVLAMAVAGVAIMLREQEREKRVAKERELEMTLAEAQSLRAKLDDAQTAKTHLEQELGQTRQQLTQSQDELAKQTEAQEKLSRAVNDREQEISRLTKDLEQARSDAKQTAAQVSDLQAERDAVKQQLAQLEKAKGELETKVTELSSHPTVELDKVLVTNNPSAATNSAPTATGTAAPTSSVGTKGEVVVINREYDFIVMNLGKNHGLSIGQEFQVVRGDQVLGHVKVEKVYDELSAAAILPDSQKENIREGDTVKAL